MNCPAVEVAWPDALEEINREMRTSERARIGKLESEERRKVVSIGGGRTLVVRSIITQEGNPGYEHFPGSNGSPRIALRASWRQIYGTVYTQLTTKQPKNCGWQHVSRPF
jgi:hypothetical protein